MMLIVRMYPRYEVDKVWKVVEERVSKLKGNSVVPLFMSEQDYQNYVSVIMEVHDADALADFFMANIASCEEIVRTTTVTLLKPAFFPVPKNVPEGTARYLVPVKMDPCNYTKVYDRVLKLEPPKGVYFAYVALTLGEDDMLISLLAKDAKLVRKFVSEQIETVDGVQSVRIGLTHRTKRLTDLGTWKAHQEKYALSRFLPGARPREEYGFDWTYLDVCSIHGALPEEA